MSYWNFDPTYTSDDTVKWQMDFERLQSEVVAGMRQREEEATVYVVLEYLRGRGYSVSDPGESQLSRDRLNEWLEYAIESNRKTAQEVEPWQASKDYWQGRVEAYKLVQSLLEVGKFDD